MKKGNISGKISNLIPKDFDWPSVIKTVAELALTVILIIVENESDNEKED